MRKMLAIAVAAVAMLATLTLSAAPASATSVTFLLPRLTASAPPPTAVCEPPTVGVSGSGKWTTVVSGDTRTHAPTFTLHAVCYTGLGVDIYDFTITADTIENCNQGQGEVDVTGTGPRGPFTGSGLLTKAAGVFDFAFSITPASAPSKSYDVALSVFRDPDKGTGIPCNYTTLDLVGHGVVAYA